MIRCDAKPVKSEFHTSYDERIYINNNQDKNKYAHTV